TALRTRRTKRCSQPSTPSTRKRTRPHAANRRTLRVDPKARFPSDGRLPNSRACLSSEPKHLDGRTSSNDHAVACSTRTSRHPEGQHMVWKAGASRHEVTTWEEGVYLFGWGDRDNKSLAVRTALCARALVLDDGTTPLALVLVDLGIITYTIRRFALRALREAYPDCPIQDEHILLSATHTHS